MTTCDWTPPVTLIPGGFLIVTMATTCSIHSYAKGDSYRVEWNRVHKLDNLADHTLTLVVESPVARYFSEAFYNGSVEPSLFCDFVELHPRLAAEMASL